MSRILLPLIMLGMWPAPLAASSANAGRLDTTLIHKLYMDGDFEQSISLCEGALKESLRGFRLTRTDSVFLFKHLGVMHTAEYETRELGKKYMYQLLHVEPTAKIMDLYASDMIYMIFKNISDEYEMRRAQATGASPSADSIPGSTSSVSKPESRRAKDSKRSGWVPWILGGAAVAGGTVAAYYLSSDERVSSENVVP